MLLLQGTLSLSALTAQETSRGMVPGAQVLISTLPMIAIIVFGILAFFYLKWEHQKRMLIIEKGGELPPAKFNEKLLLIGLLSLFIGIGLTVFFIIQTGLSNALLGGIIPLTAGLGIITYIIIIRIKKT
jgi:hypothetical protein